MSRMSVASIRSWWLGDGMTSLTDPESGENTCIGLICSDLSNGFNLNASLSLTVVNYLFVIRPARERCIDAHICPMAPHVNRSFSTASAVSVAGPTRHVSVLLRQAMDY